MCSSNPPDQRLESCNLQRSQILVSAVPRIVCVQLLATPAKHARRFTGLRKFDIFLLRKSESRFIFFYLQSNFALESKIGSFLVFRVFVQKTNRLSFVPIPLPFCEKSSLHEAFGRIFGVELQNETALITLRKVETKPQISLDFSLVFLRSLFFLHYYYSVFVRVQAQNNKNPKKYQEYNQTPAHILPPNFSKANRAIRTASARP